MYKIKHAPYSRDAIVAYNNETIYPCLFMLLPMDTQRFEPDRATTTAVVHRSLHTQSLHRQIPRRGFHYTRPIKQHSAELKQQQPRKGISSLPLTFVNTQAFPLRVSHAGSSLSTHSILQLGPGSSALITTQRHPVFEDPP
jgi:hypothetical protein